jgi:uncharacterized protein (TIGR03086 family)
MHPVWHRRGGGSSYRRDVEDVRELYRRALHRFGGLVHAVGDGQWNLPTPNAEWDVRELVNHLVSENRWIPPLLAGGTVEDVGNSLDGDLLGDDPRGAWDRAAAEAERAVLDTPPGKVVHLAGRDSRASRYVFEVFTDLAIHGWDLARSIGADQSLDPDIVDLLYATYHPLEAALKASGQYGSRVEPPPEASTQTKLLAVFGRVG